MLMRSLGGEDILDAFVVVVGRARVMGKGETFSWSDELREIGSLRVWRTFATAVATAGKACGDGGSMGRSGSIRR